VGRSDTTSPLGIAAWPPLCCLPRMSGPRTTRPTLQKRFAGCENGGRSRRGRLAQLHWHAYRAADSSPEQMSVVNASCSLRFVVGRVVHPCIQLAEFAWGRIASPENINYHRWLDRLDIFSSWLAANRALSSVLLRCRSQSALFCAVGMRIASTASSKCT
jgi:hypothetical protein